MAFSQSQNVASACGPLKRPRDGPWKLEALGPRYYAKGFTYDRNPQANLIPPLKSVLSCLKNAIEI